MHRRLAASLLLLCAQVAPLLGAEPVPAASPAHPATATPAAVNPGPPETWDATHLRPLVAKSLSRTWATSDDGWFHRLDVDKDLRGEVDTFLRLTAGNPMAFDDLRRSREPLVQALLPTRDALLALAKRKDLALAFPTLGPTTPNPYVEPLGVGRTLSLVGLDLTARGDLDGAIALWWGMAEVGRKTMALGHGQAACISGNGLLVNACKGLEMTLDRVRLSAEQLADPRLAEILADDGGASVAASWAGEFSGIIMPQIAWVERRRDFYVAFGSPESLAATKAYDDLAHLMDADVPPGLTPATEPEERLERALAAGMAAKGIKALDIAATTKALAESAAKAQELVQAPAYPKVALKGLVETKLHARSAVIEAAFTLLVKEPAIANDPTKHAAAVAPLVDQCANLVGDEVHGYLLPDIRATDGSARRVRAAQRVLRTAIAVRRYDLAHHGRPKTLQDLVTAKLLDAVPVDPWDGQPLRYDPVAGKVWSVGLDHTDNGGQGRGAHAGDPDQVAMVQRDPPDPRTMMPPGMRPGPGTATAAKPAGR